MQQVVYADVLIFVNVFVNYFLLISASRVMRAHINRWRILAAAFAGGIFSLVIFLPPIHFSLSMLMNLAASMLIVYIAFKVSTIKMFFKMYLTFFLMNFAYAGAMMAIWLLYRPGGMHMNNGAVYFNINIMVLATSTVISYIIISLISYFTRKNAADSHIYSIEIELAGKRAEGKAFLDTGNALTDGFSDTPVILANIDFLAGLFPGDLYEIIKAGNFDFSALDFQWQKKLRVVSYHSAGSEGLLAAFRPDFVRLKDLKGSGRLLKSGELLIGISAKRFSGGEYDVLLNSRLFDI